MFSKRHISQPGYNPPIAKYWADRGIKVAYARLDDRELVSAGNPLDVANASGVGLGLNPSGGTGDYIVVDDWSSILSKDSGVMLCLARPTNLAKANQFLLSAREGIGGGRYYLSNNSGALTFGWVSTWHIATTVTLDSNPHVAMLSWTAANDARCYYDGEEVGSSTLTQTGDPTFAAIAALANGPTITTYHHGAEYTLVAFGSEGLSPEDAKYLSEDPWSLFADEVLLLKSVSAGALLAGDASSIATATGDLRIGVQFAGDASSIATATGELTVDIPLAGDASAIATATGDLRVGVQFAGDASSIATATGELTVDIPLAGDASAIAVATGDLRVGVQLFGDASVIATATGNLVVGIQLSGDATTSATATGDLTTALLEEIIAMAADSQGKKKSDFPALNNIPSDATFDFVSNGANYKIPVSDFLSSLSVTGTIVQDGAVTGVPVLDTAGAVHKVRNIEAGAGIAASVSAENGLALTHAFVNGSGGVPLLTDLTTTPTIRNLIAGTGITLTEVAGGVEVSLT